MVQTSLLTPAHSDLHATFVRRSVRRGGWREHIDQKQLVLPSSPASPLARSLCLSGSVTLFVPLHRGQRRTKEFVPAGVRLLAMLIIIIWGHIRIWAGYSRGFVSCSPVCIDDVDTGVNLSPCVSSKQIIGTKWAPELRWEAGEKVGRLSLAH